MSLTAEAKTYLRSYIAAEPGLTYTRQRTLQRYVAEALAELDRLQATATRRGELLRRAQTALADLRFDNGVAPRQRAHDVMGAITAELAEGEDGQPKPTVTIHIEPSHRDLFAEGYMRALTEGWRRG